MSRGSGTIPYRKLEATIGQAQAAGVDPEILGTLTSSRDMFHRRDEFTLESTSDPSETLEKINQETYSHDWQAECDQGNTPGLCVPYMLCGKLQGQLLKSLVSMQGAKRILEVGLFTGYSALSMAEALPADGELVSLEICKRLKNLSEELVKDSHHAKKIRVEVGPALETVRTLVNAGEKFDMMFLDGEKKDYIEFVKIAFDENLLSEGGTVLIDNAYFQGSAYCPSLNINKNKLARELLGALKSRPYLHKVLLPINDGMLMIRRMKDVERDLA